MSVPLLMTKLHIPAPGKYLVARARLVEKLNQTLEPGCRLALVSAPAGFGKTTLLAAWIAAARDTAPEAGVAWLSIDEGDNDPVIFWTYIIAALQTQQTEIGQQALDLLAVQGADLEPKLAVLINDLARIAHPCLLVLDDYHLIRSPQIHQSLAFFIEHAPPHIHLMIASRTDPPLPLSRLRGRGQLLEVRLHDLRFSDEDAAAYLNGGIGFKLAAPSVQALNQKAEGWVAGLQMAVLAMQDMARSESALTDFVASFSGSNRFILDYLIEEVLNRQPEPMQQFLIRTAMVDRLCGPLCDTLLKGSEAAAASSAQSTLEYLESCNLFIFPLDQQRYWYRYHQLFADLLRKRLLQSSPELIQDLHRRAIQWYEQNGLVSNAIQHAFLLQDFQKAGELVAQVAGEMWGRGEHATLLAWMDALPEAEKAKYPHLLTFQVSILISAGKLQEAEACIPILERYIADALKSNPDQTALIGKVETLRTYIASFYEDQPAIFAHGRTALENLPGDENAGQRCGVALVLGHAYLVTGDLPSAAQIFGEGIADAKKARKLHMAFTGLSNLAEVLWLQGQLSRAAQVCEEGLQLGQQYHLDRSPMGVDIMLAWGEILRERGELVEAEPYIRKALELAQEQQYVWQVSWGYQAQARLLLAQDNLPEAEAAAQAAEQWSASHSVPAHFTCGAAGLLGEIWLRQGKTAQNERYLQARSIQADGEIQFPHQSEYLVLARLKGMQGDTAVASQILGRLCVWAEPRQHTRTWVAALVQQALLSQRSGSLPASLSMLERALALAHADGYTRVFVEAGEAMADLLEKAANLTAYSDYVRRLRSAFPATVFAATSEKDEASNLPKVEQDQPKRTTSGAAALAEPLSRREMETLRLMAEGYSNKEIAQRLSISLRTVKYYSTGLYNKLGVDSRMQAVNRARELGLL